MFILTQRLWFLLTENFFAFSTCDIYIYIVDLQCSKKVRMIAARACRDAGIVIRENRHRYGSITSENQEVENCDRVISPWREPSLRSNLCTHPRSFLHNTSEVRDAKLRARRCCLRNRRCKRVCITENLGRRHCFAVESTLKGGERKDMKKKNACVQSKTTLARPWSRTFDLTSR